MKRLFARPELFALLVMASATGAGAAPDAARLFADNCAECHGSNRLGAIGPALLPQNLVRLRKKNAARTIARGLEATQMPAFGDKLKPEEIRALVEFIYTPLPYIPRWDKAQMMASRILTPPEIDTDTLTYDADPLNLFVVVETGDHHATILNGDTFEPVFRFQTRFALHGGPKYTPDGRYVFFASRDGWISKFDLYTLQITAEIRAGINTRNMALSADGKRIAVANYLPHTLVILSADDLAVEKIFRVTTKDGQTSSRVSAVYQARPRGSFIAALKDIPELWEISTVGTLELRRLSLDRPMDDFFFDQSYAHVLGSTRGGKNAEVVDINSGRKVASIPLPGLPHLGSGITFTYKGRRVMATPHIRESMISIIDMDTWQVIKTIKTNGPGFFMRSHENTPYAWAGVFFGPNRDMMQIIDKRSLEIVKILRPVPGKTFAHVEFTRNASHALVSLWEKDGALFIYDAKTFRLVKRLPMSKPSGKYNVYNKIHFSEGTSH